MPNNGRMITLVIALLLGVAMPVLGVSLLLFIMVDVLRWRMANAVLSSRPAR